MMAVTAAAAVLVLLLQLSPTAAATAAPPAAEHCRSARCGGVEVPYPFGITPGCSYPAPGFNLTCDERHTPPRLLLGDGTLRVMEISIEDNMLHAVQAGGVNISRPDGRGVWLGAGMGPGSPFDLYPGGMNELVVTGCNVQATLHGEDGSIISGCSSFCSGSVKNGGFIRMYGGDGQKFCSGIGCCQAPIPQGLTSLDVHFKWLDEANASVHWEDSDDGQPVNVFIADVSWFDKKEVGKAIMLGDNDSKSQRRRRRAGPVEVPVVLEWAIPPLEAKHTTAESTSQCTDIEASNRICRSPNSTCSDIGRGYTCSCPEGYQGNPYLPNGCQDIDECENPQAHECFGRCINTDGSYECSCPRGHHGNSTLPNGCVRSITGLIIGVSVASGPAFLLLVIGVFLILRKIKQQKVRRLRQKFFKQNRGQLLQQLVSQRADIAERMIIPLEEIEKATNNFDQSRKLGGGGHGTVYKGILSDLHVVAIKKPKIAVEREIREFINEVAILSQINHRNVVKLLGCCLEVEVPLLVYEFISNGTLHDHLHKQEATAKSLSWRDRLRIANETAKAIAYLHSSVSIPIVHRDIKSANILLDDALTAKVSDFGASRYIPIDQTGGTTAVQGTPGYLDPMYCSTGLLTEMSDVYSFGVILIELLTRKVPNSYRTLEGGGLVGKFNSLLEKGNLVEILDPQVVDEGGREIAEVAALAASCTKSEGEERPTMRQVEIALEAFQAPEEHMFDDVLVENTEGNMASSNLLTRRRTNTEEVTRQYSLEEEFMISARYPR